MLATLREYGQPLEADWPYLAALPADLGQYGPPPGLTVFRRKGEAQPHLLDNLVACIDAESPAVALMMISDAFYAPDARGVVVAPVGEGPDPQRRHAVVAVGHGRVSGERGLLVRNSWGVSWGLVGHAWLTESFLTPRLTHAARLTEKVDVSAPNFAT
jgi:C1A family cysteine protease